MQWYSKKKLPQAYSRFVPHKIFAVFENALLHEHFTQTKQIFHHLLNLTSYFLILWSQLVSSMEPSCYAWSRMLMRKNVNNYVNKKSRTSGCFLSILDLFCRRRWSRAQRVNHYGSHQLWIGFPSSVAASEPATCRLVLFNLLIVPGARFSQGPVNYRARYSPG